ncbi:putative pre-mrna splicing factor protein [Seiridium unicorne]|uniref:Pre-mrna splicing factor protein n=1 Tax=Seiridium unicorne TaxID=138068 RepID=A0ABR2ULG9_9PEZI
MTEVSATRLYLGNLPKGVTKADVEAHFATHGTGEITEIKLMNGFGFIEYKDAMDARDVVPAFHGSDFMGERLTVQFARGSRQREGFGNHERAPPRPRRTPYRMQITGLPNDTSWQDLKDFARQSSLDVVYSETGRDGKGSGSFVEFETEADLRSAVEKLDQREFKGQRVTCAADVRFLLLLCNMVFNPAHHPDATAIVLDLLEVAVALTMGVLLATTTDVDLPGATVHVEMITVEATVIAAHEVAETPTMRTAATAAPPREEDPLQTIMVSLEAEEDTMTPTDETMDLPSLTPTVAVDRRMTDLLMMDLRGTTHLVTVASVLGTVVMLLEAAKSIVEGAAVVVDTGNSFRLLPSGIIPYFI